MEHKCPLCGSELEDATAVAAAKVRAIVADWNIHAVPLGFAKVSKVTAARARTLKAALKERPDLRDWNRAIRAYAADVKRWPERIKYGFDTFIRPSQRDRWFEAPVTNDPRNMTDDEADDYYTRNMR